MSWERNVGGAIVGDFGDLRCRDAKGSRRSRPWSSASRPGATTGPNAIKVAALDVPMFNAAALPGGYIVVFKPAITETDPDALAGVLAHEVAHVRRRHVTEALIRELGIGALIRLFAGNLGANAEQIVALSYTRDNEAQADADAIVMLQPGQHLAQAHRRPVPAPGEGSARHSAPNSSRAIPLSGNARAQLRAKLRSACPVPAGTDREQGDALFDICRARVVSKAHLTDAATNRKAPFTTSEGELDMTFSRPPRSAIIGASSG